MYELVAQGVEALEDDAKYAAGVFASQCFVYVCFCLLELLLPVVCLYAVVWLLVVAVPKGLEDVDVVK